MNLINTRESQFELLRIVAIFMVLIHHSLAVADTFGYTGHYTLNEGITGVLLNSAVIIGVNLFVLITGWFGVSDKKIFRKILFLLIETALPRSLPDKVNSPTSSLLLKLSIHSTKEEKFLVPFLSIILTKSFL